MRGGQPRTKVVWTEKEADQPSEFTASARSVPSFSPSRLMLTVRAAG